MILANSQNIVGNTVCRYSSDTGKHFWSARPADQRRPWRRRDQIPRTAAIFGQVPVPVHSAHVEQAVTVQYRWHPFFGRRFRRYHSQRRADGEVCFRRGSRWRGRADAGLDA